MEENKRPSVTTETSDPIVEALRQTLLSLPPGKSVLSVLLKEHRDKIAGEWIRPVFESVTEWSKEWFGGLTVTLHPHHLIVGKKFGDLYVDSVLIEFEFDKESCAAYVVAKKLNQKANRYEACSKFRFQNEESFRKAVVLAVEEMFPRIVRMHQVSSG